MAWSIISWAFLLENQDLKLSRRLAKNHFVFSHVSWIVFFVFSHKSWAHWVILSWISATVCAACHGKTAPATLFTESFTILVAEVAALETISTQLWTTDCAVLTVVDTAFSATCAVVSTVHCIAAFHDSKIQSPDVAHETIFSNHSLISLQISLIHLIAFWDVSFMVFHHSSIVDFIVSTHWLVAFWTHWIQASQYSWRNYCSTIVD